MPCGPGWLCGDRPWRPGWPCDGRPCCPGWPGGGRPCGPGWPCAPRKSCASMSASDMTMGPPGPGGSGLPPCGGARAPGCSGGCCCCIGMPLCMGGPAGCCICCIGTPTARCIMGAPPPAGGPIWPPQSPARPDAGGVPMAVSWFDLQYRRNMRKLGALFLVERALHGERAHCASESSRCFGWEPQSPTPSARCGRA